jgi:molybdate transport system permease protein
MASGPRPGPGEARIPVSQTSYSIYLSFKVALVATAGVVVVGTAFAWLLARRRFPGRSLLDVLLTLPLVLPPTVTGYYLLVLFGRHGVIGRPLYDLTGWTLLFTWWAAALASFVVALPLMVKTARAALEAVDERYLDAATMLGYSERESFFRVLLPLSRRGLIAGAVLAFARALGEFGATLMVAGNLPGQTDTMPLVIYGAAASGNWAQANAMVLLFTVVSAAVLYLTVRLVGR